LQSTQKKVEKSLEKQMILNGKNALEANDFEWQKML